MGRPTGRPDRRRPYRRLRDGTSTEGGGRAGWQSQPLQVQGDGCLRRCRRQLDMRSLGGRGALWMKQWRRVATRRGGILKRRGRRSRWRRGIGRRRGTTHSRGSIMPRVVRRRRSGRRRHRAIRRRVGNVDQVGPTKVRAGGGRRPCDGGAPGALRRRHGGGDAAQGTHAVAVEQDAAETATRWRPRAIRGRGGWRRPRLAQRASVLSDRIIVITEPLLLGQGPTTPTTTWLRRMAYDS